MRGRSYTPSPPPRYGRRGGGRRSPSPRDRYTPHSRDSDFPTSLLVRNLRHDCRPEDLRRPFGQFGPFKDIYLPWDYYTGKSGGLINTNRFRSSTAAAVEDLITPQVPITYTQHLINSQFVDAASGKTFPTNDPRTREVIAHVAEGDTEDINRAVAAARKAFDEGP